jgi:protein-tyrosine phosphatase
VDEIMIHVLFVCLGNICRSPMAEAIFRQLVSDYGLEDKIHVDSAGTGDWHVGNAPHKGTQEILKENHILFNGIVARQLNNKDLSDFTYIIAMDAENLGEIHRLARYEKTGEIARLLDFVENIDYEDVPDPYYTGNFQEVYELIHNGCQHLLTYICGKEKI